MKAGLSLYPMVFELKSDKNCSSKILEYLPSYRDSLILYPPSGVLTCKIFDNTDLII